MEICYKQSTEEPGFSPCLKSKGHKGKHEHYSICRNSSCACGGLQSTLEMIGSWEEYKNVLIKIEELHKKLWKIQDEANK